MTLIFPSIGNHNPNWQVFFRWLKPPVVQTNLLSRRPHIVGDAIWTENWPTDPNISNHELWFVRFMVGSQTCVVLSLVGLQYLISFPWYEIHVYIYTNMSNTTSDSRQHSLLISYHWISFGHVPRFFGAFHQPHGSSHTLTYVEATAQWPCWPGSGLEPLHWRYVSIFFLAWIRSPQNIWLEKWYSLP